MCKQVKMENTTSYQNLLHHPKWFEKRDQILKRDNKKCLGCGNKENLQVHHRQYHFSKKNKSFVPPWQYKERYLITLCNHCHLTGHKIHTKTPIFNINQ